MTNDVSPIYVGQRKPVQKWTWTRGDGTNPDLATGSPTLSVKFIPSQQAAPFAGTGIFSGQTITGAFNYALSAADVAVQFSGTIRFTLTYADATSEIGDPIAFVINP